MNFGHTYYNRYNSVSKSPFIDGVFNLGSNKINSAGVVYDLLAGDGSNASFDFITNNREIGGSRAIQLKGKTYTSGIGMSAGSGITFNLKKFREVNGANSLTFTSDFGTMSGGDWKVRGYAVLSNSTKVLSSAVTPILTANMTPHQFSINIPEDADFLTLMVGTAGDGITDDHAGFGNARIIANSNMVAVQGGTLPQGSELAGQTVGTFQIGKYEVTWGEWKTVRDWAVNNGYTDLAGVGEGSGDEHPVQSVSWYDVVKWCNAKSELDGLIPVYELVKPLAVPLYIGYPGPFEETEIFRTGAPDESQFIRPTSGDGYRLPLEKEWEWAARGGTSSQGFTYSGSNNAATVGVFGSNSTSSVGKKSPNELVLFDMSGNVWEWLFDKDANNTEDKRFFRGGGWTDVDATYCAVGQRYVSYHAEYAPANLGFRLARNVDAPVDTTAPVITLNGENPEEVYKGAAYTDSGAVVTDDLDAPQTIQGSGTVSTSVLGVYTITYAAIDAAGNAAQPVTRRVNVVLDPAGDEDGDGMTNEEEESLGTNPENSDSDGDGVTDYREQKDETDPKSPGSFDPLSKGLVAYYPFNGNAKDQSGNNNNGIINGATLAEGIDKDASGSFSFDGISDYILIPHSEAQRVLPITISLNFKTEQSEPHVTSFLNKYYNSSFNGYRVGLINGKIEPWYLVNNSQKALSTLSGNVNDGNWHQVVVTVDASGIKTFVDSKLVSNGEWQGSPALFTSNNPIYIVGPEKPLTPGGGIGHPAIFSGKCRVWKQAQKEPASSRGSGSRRRLPAAG